MLEPGWSNRYVGIPFLDRGRDAAGLDCWGLVRLVYEEQFEIELPTFDEDYRDTDDALAIAGIFALERVEWLERPGPAPGDVVMFRLRAIPCHVGVVVDARNFLHTMAGRETCVEKLTAPAWKSNRVGYYRHRSRS